LGFAISATSEVKSRVPSASVVRKRCTLGDRMTARSHGLSRRSLILTAATAS
jgi:hypothetical protein